MYKPKNFELYELLPKNIYEETMRYGETRWQWFDNRLLITLQALRDKEGKIILNDWYWGGKHQYRVFRPFNCEIGALWSMHKSFKAADCIFVETTAERVRTRFLENPGNYSFITCVETEISWFHFDVRNWDVSKYGILQIPFS